MTRSMIVRMVGNGLKMFKLVFFKYYIVLFKLIHVQFHVL